MPIWFPAFLFTTIVGLFTTLLLSALEFSAAVREKSFQRNVARLLYLTFLPTIAFLVCVIVGSRITPGLLPGKAALGLIFTVFVTTLVTPSTVAYAASLAGDALCHKPADTISTTEMQPANIDENVANAGALG